MNTPQVPSVELIQGSSNPEAPVTPRWRRWQVFLVVFAVATAIGLTIVYARSPVYRAAASVLTVKPKAVDTASAQADLEHVAVQGRLLLGEELLSHLSRRLEEQDDVDTAGIEALRSALMVVPVAGTNLLELRADGPDPVQLPRLVNLWAESYESFRLQEIESLAARTTAELRDEQVQLMLRIEAARGELSAFRQTNNIVSLERDENRSLATLKGLNNSLNKAREILVAAQANKAAIDEAVAKGATVVSREQKAEITRMKLDVERARSQLEDLKQKYTQAYIERDPALEHLPEKLHDMQRELAQALEIGRQSMREEAQRSLDAAVLSVTALEEKLDEQQDAVQEFTERFKQFKLSEENLTRLERVYAENDERLARIMVRNQKDYPPLEIIELARIPTRPIYPNYGRDLIIALVGALSLALFFTWLFEYLTERARPAAGMPYLGVRVYPGDRAQLFDSPAVSKQLSQGAANAAALSHEADGNAVASANAPFLPRELANAEVSVLLNTVDPVVAGYSALLLSGVSPHELSLLRNTSFSENLRRVTIPGASERELALGGGVIPLLDGALADMYALQMTIPLSELDRRLVDAARDADLGDPESVNALALLHSYVLYLIRQGIERSALTRHIGDIPPAMHEVLQRCAPPGGARPLESIDFNYPFQAV